MYRRHTKEQHTTALAAYLPSGRLFEAKNINDSNFRKLLRGFAGELFTAEGYLKTFDEEYNPLNTVLFIEEWERAVGIPDSCFSIAASLNERRQNILTKLAALGIQTQEDFVALAAVLGIVVTVTPLSDDIFSPFTLPTARFGITVTGTGLESNYPPYDIPLTLESGQSLLECLFNKVKPANCQVVFKNA